jgi:hypothetical protein
MMNHCKTQPRRPGIVWSSNKSGFNLGQEFKLEAVTGMFRSTELNSHNPRKPDSRE